MSPANGPPLKTLPLIAAKSDKIIFFGIDRIAISLEKRGRRMLKSLIKGLVLVAVDRSVNFFVRSTNCLRWELFRAGHRGSKLRRDSQWQSRYGGGAFNGCDFPPPPYCGPAYSHPAALQETAFSVSSAEDQERQEQEITAPVTRHTCEHPALSQRLQSRGNPFP